MDSDKASIDLNGLSVTERTALLVALLDKSPIKHLLLDATEPDVAIMLFAADNVVPWDECNVPTVRSYYRWQARHLVVLGPTENPTAWSIHSLFSGHKQALQIPHAQTLPLFSEAGGPRIFEPFEVSPGIDIAITVSHALPGPQAFRALLLGRRLKD